MLHTINHTKKIARHALKGHWKEAVLLNLIPIFLKIFLFWGLLLILLFYFLFTAFPVFNFNVPAIVKTTDYPISELFSLPSVVITSLFLALLYTGIEWRLLALVRALEAEFLPLEDSLQGFKKGVIGNNLAIICLTYLFLLGWSLLFIVPGVLKHYAYSQARFIYYDQQHTCHNARDTITQSRHLMTGHKAELFLLDLSFIGWHFLACLSLGIGYIWLNPYIRTTKAAYYDYLTAATKA